MYEGWLGNLAKRGVWPPRLSADAVFLLRLFSALISNLSHPPRSGARRGASATGGRHQLRPESGAYFIGPPTCSVPRRRAPQKLDTDTREGSEKGGEEGQGSKEKISFSGRCNHHRHQTGTGRPRADER